MESSKLDFALLGLIWTIRGRSTAVVVSELGSRTLERLHKYVRVSLTTLLLYSTLPYITYITITSLQRHVASLDIFLLGLSACLCVRPISQPRFVAVIREGGPAFSAGGGCRVAMTDRHCLSRSIPNFCERCPRFRIMNMNQIYYVFGFLYVVFFILIATCAEITMVMCYFQLCNEDYRW